jgi:competence protein ComEC
VRGLTPFTITHHLLAFAAGVAILALPVGYPVYRWEMLVIVLIAGLAAWWIASRWASSRWPAAFSAGLLLCTILGGILYGGWRIGAAMTARLPQCADESIREFHVIIEGEPQIESDGIARLVGQVALLEHDPDCTALGRHRVRLTWYDAPELASGQTWRVEGKLRPPWGYRNPGGFDYERWLLGAGLHGTGYIRSGSLLATRGEADLPWLSALRISLAEWVAAQEIRHGPLVLALLTGDDSGISSQQWNWLRRSGTIHLVVVSGLHVGMIAGGLLFSCLWLIRLLPMLLGRFGARRPASLTALIGSGCYVLLSGSGIPAVRSWLMTAVALFAIGSGRRLAPGQALSLVVVAVLVHDPLAVHQQGFWLSFTAVAALLGFFLPRRAVEASRRDFRRVSGAVSGFTRAQLVLLLALAPLLALTQGSVPLHSPIANGLVVPLVTLAVLPLVLLAGACAFWLPGPAGGLLWLADVGLETVMQVVERAAAIDPFSAVVGDGLELVLLLLSAASLCLAPGLARAIPLVVLWVGLLMPAGESVRPGSFRVLALDVGQGSAIFIETRNHRLLYDSGPGFPSGFNLGEAVVVPSYRRRYAIPPDGLVLSHDDLDHTGGAWSILEDLQPRTVWRSWKLAGGRPEHARRCVEGQRWFWDGVSFEFLHPPFSAVESVSSGDTSADNDASCVLLIEAGNHRALIAGDISRHVERRLELPVVDLLFAPHHGSRTSSSAGFVRRTRPSIVFISTSRRSRYGHPHPEVLRRYREVGARVSVTGRHGALEWISSSPEIVKRWRGRERAYWQLGYQTGDADHADDDGASSR